jgi:hydrogenase maturation protease
LYLRDEEILSIQRRKKLAIVGIGNVMAGDDGAGVEVVSRLRETWGDDPDIMFHTLEGDHFQLADLIGHAERFVFVDAIEGRHPGELVTGVKVRRAFAPSFHQTDISSVMNALEVFGIADPFPPWEIRGITITPPAEMWEGLSPEVEKGVKRLCSELDRLIADTVSLHGG